jgi:hypothetical protein
MELMVSCAHRLHLMEDSATSLLLVSCIHRCSGQGCTETFLLRFQAVTARFAPDGLQKVKIQVKG